MAANRRAHADRWDAPRFLPGQALDLGSAPAAYTAGSAYVNHRDDTGTVAEGHLADLVVLDRDPFEGGDDGIGSTRVLRTFVGGQEVYAAGS